MQLTVIIKIQTDPSIIASISLTSIVDSSYIKIIEYKLVSAYRSFFIHIKLHTMIWYMSTFKAYCAQKGYYTQDVSKCTHLFMDGGKLNIQNDDLPDFLTTYVNCIVSGERLCLVEKLGDSCNMRFFLDIDAKQDFELQSILDVATQVVGLEGNVYSCTSGYGYHVVYNKVVSAAQASELSEKIKKLLEKAEADLIDKSVYRTGLRMLGSCKYNHKTKQIDERWYTPPTGQITLDTMKPSIVRINTVYTKKEQAICIPCDWTRYYKAMCRLSKEYAQAKILGVKQFGETLSIRTDSNYCMNIGRNHNSCHVYFVVCDGKMYQKCFCSCMNAKGRKFDYCNKFRSHAVTVPKTVH